MLASSANLPRVASLQKNESKFIAWYCYALAGFVIALDQVTKLWADSALAYREIVPVTPFFNITLAYNKGAAFSFLADHSGWQRWFFAALALVAAVVLIVWIWRIKPAERLMSWPLSLVLGGAIGNLIDRLAYGHVVDFLDFFYGRYHWPAFNVADSAIVCGAAWLIWLSFFPSARHSSLDQ